MVVTKDQPTTNTYLLDWVEEMERLCKPDDVYWVDGSDDENKRLTEKSVSDGVLIPLNQTKRPNSFYSRSNPNDVARVEELTFICTPTKAEAGNTNNWMSPDEAYTKLREISSGAMKGRTMYVIPYIMGTADSPFAMIGVEITDSLYVVLNMRIMARIGKVESRDARSATRVRRLEDPHHRRRHRVDARRRRWSPLRGEPRGGVLWRRAGHEPAHEPRRDEDARARLHLHERRAHAGHGRV